MSTGSTTRILQTAVASLGEAKIKVKALDGSGKEAQCTVKVYEKYEKADAPELDYALTHAIVFTVSISAIPAFEARRLDHIPDLCVRVQAGLFLLCPKDYAFARFLRVYVITLARHKSQE